MSNTRLYRGGEFLITEALPEEIFTPEDFDRDQRLIGKSAEEFHLKEVLPSKEDIEAFNPELTRKMLIKLGKLGFLGADIPEVYGGTELDKVSSTLISEHISAGVPGFSTTFAVQTGIGSLPIVLFGTQDQKERYLPGLASGELVGAYALTESEHGSDALSADTTAVLSDDGYDYLLNGQKQFISNAGFADIFLTYGQVDETRFTSFIVERDWEGVSLDEEEKKMGMHGSSTRGVIFTNVRVPRANLLGEIGKGHVVALNSLNIGRYKLGAISLGGAKTLLAEAIKYAKARVQFGKPICEFGLIKHKLAEMIIRIYVNESMIYRTAGLLDMALKDIDLTREDSGFKTGEAIRRYALECSINKVYGSEALGFVADECVQIMGGYGFIRDYPAEGAYRDARINRIWEGTNEINRLLIVDMLMKAAMKGELPLMEAIKKITDELLTSNQDMAEEDKILEKEKKMVHMAKKMGLIAAGAAARKYMTKLADEQEIVALISDIIIEIFAMESALLRTLKIIEKQGEARADIQAAVTRVYIFETFPRVELMAKQIFAALSEGEELKTSLTVLKKLAKYTPVNSVALRRKIAENSFPAARYHLTKL